MAVDPDDPGLYRIIAYALIQLKDPEAVEWGRKAVAITPDEAYAWICLAHSLNSQRRWREGLEIFRKVETMDPRIQTNNQNLGHTLLHLSRINEAIPYLEKAIQINPTQAEVHRYLSAAKFSIGDVEEAEKHVRKALEIDPENYLAHSLLGWELLATGRRKEADETFVGTLRINPKLKEPKLVLGEWMPQNPKLEERIMHISLKVPHASNPRLLIALQAMAITTLSLLGELFLQEAGFAIFLVDLALLLGIISIALPDWIIRKVSKKRIARCF